MTVFKSSPWNTPTLPVVLFDLKLLCVKQHTRPVTSVRYRPSTLTFKRWMFSDPIFPSKTTVDVLLWHHLTPHPDFRDFHLSPSLMSCLGTFCKFKSLLFLLSFFVCLPFPSYPCGSLHVFICDSCSLTFQGVCLTEPFGCIFGSSYTGKLNLIVVFLSFTWVYLSSYSIVCFRRPDRMWKFLNYRSSFLFC